MKRGGYILLYRSLLDWEWADNPNTLSTWIHLLISANYEENEWHGHIIQAGQLITSLPSLSKKTGLSVQTIRTSLDHLKSTGEITVQSTNKFRIITIVNWASYQLAFSESTGKETDSSTGNQQAINRQSTANKEVNEINELNKDMGTNVPLLPQVQCSEIVRLWNTLVIALPPVQKLTEIRKKAIKARWDQNGRNINAFHDVFRSVQESDFLCGRTEKHWTGCGFDWVLCPSNWQKIKEGNYTNKKFGRQIQMSEAERIMNIARDREERGRNEF